MDEVVDRPDAAGRPNPDTPRRRGLRVVIVGAGIGGIAAAVELMEHGFHDLVLLERASGLGGTWRYNSYPGCACDVPSHLYSFSWAQRKDWSRLCSPQDEILHYLHEVAEQRGVDRLVVPEVNVVACDWSDRDCLWRVRSEDGREWEAEAVVLACGQLHQPAVPRFEGASEFAGRTFHSARWDHDYDLRGKRVAVVGTGATAVQVVPEVAEQAARLTVFQRTGNWMLPRRNRTYPSALRWLFRLIPGLEALRRAYVFNYTETLTLAIRHPRTVGRAGWLWSTLFMGWQLRGDAELRRRVWPRYTFGCKRILFSSRFLPALRRENVSLITEPVARLSPRGIVTADGAEHAVDCIIYATGFRTTEFMFPMEIRGREGRSLAEAWRDGAHAHLGVAVPGFPSLFMVYGPNTNTSGGSIIFFEEQQAAYIRQAVQHLRSRGAGGMEVREEVEAASDRELQARFDGTAWLACDSWYRDQTGRIVTNWPGYMREYAEQLRLLDATEYEFLPAPTPAVEPAFAPA